MKATALTSYPLLLSLALSWLIPCRAEDHAPAPGKAEAHAVPESMSAAKALKELQDGNARYVAGGMKHNHQNAERRAEVATGQNPLAIIVGCADSRVAPEVIFDQGLGDLFVLRVAGNVIDDNVIGSIEYAVEHLGTRLVVVLGHERCGAISSARGAIKDNQLIHNHIASLVDEIRPAVATVNGKTYSSPPSNDAGAKKTLEDKKLDDTVIENARNSARELRESTPVLAEREGLEVRSARYDLDTGEVTFYDPVESRLVDEVRPGDSESEGAHAFEGEKTHTGANRYRTWRDSQDHFSYRVKVLPGQQMTLRCTYWGEEFGHREFQILVDGTKIAEESLRFTKTGDFFDVDYPIPLALTQAPPNQPKKEFVTVKFQAKRGNTAGGLYGLQVLKPEPSPATAPPAPTSGT